MASKRKLPFGYEVRQGKVVIHKAEAEVVCWIYKQYAEGRSYADLLTEVREQPIPYQEGKLWNKNMIARILADERYTGVEQCPEIISSELYWAARAQVTDKVAPIKRSEGVCVIQRLAQCSTCGSRICRESYRHGKERWYCPVCKGISTNATDARLEQQTMLVLDGLVRTPSRVVNPPRETKKPDYEIEDYEKALQNLVSTPNFDEEMTRDLVLKLTAARFNVLGSEDYETLRIQSVLVGTKHCNDLNIELLKQIVDAVLIFSDGDVALRLKNGQIVERMWE